MVTQAQKKNKSEILDDASRWDDASLWFKSQYGIKRYSFALREYRAKSILKNDKRYKVVDIYPEKIDGLYFAVYSKKPVKETGHSDSIYGDTLTEHSIRITYSYKN